jgi:hypothetical protein
MWLVYLYKVTTPCSTTNSSNGRLNMIQSMQYFSMEKFQSSYGIHFFCRWAVAYALSRTSPAILAGSALAGGLVVAYALGRNTGNQPQDSARR